ncbi:hypothetical protein BIW11_07966 [Tropilaelaps mercedesae]|uniref:Uncharacterized protein n=1 Tax=Tropilaelaps mercedesae TaxID=418985 RepID=A0A1V9XRY6_9ACAR|nr:hypothetical protein BIW11_07966 [Tropilaelaps mercedesae]
MAGSGDDYFDNVECLWDDNEKQCKNTPGSSTWLLEKSVAEQKIHALQRELKEQNGIVADLRNRIRELEIQLEHAHEDLLNQKPPTNAELWQQLTATKELVEELRTRCERLTKEALAAKRIREKRAVSENSVDELKQRYLNSCIPSSTNLRGSSSTSITLTSSTRQVSLRNEIEHLETLLARKDADIKEFREELIEGAELLEKANSEVEELKKKIENLEEETQTLRGDNSKAVSVNLRLHKRIDRLDHRLQETINELYAEKQRNSFLADKLESAETERRTDVNLLKSQLQQAMKGLESLSDKQKSATSLKNGLSHLIAKLRSPKAKESRSQIFVTDMSKRRDRQHGRACKQKH